MNLLNLLYTLASAIAPKGMLPNGLRSPLSPEPASKSGRVTSLDRERIQRAEAKRARKAERRSKLAA